MRESGMRETMEMNTVLAVVTPFLRAPTGGYFQVVALYHCGKI